MLFRSYHRFQYIWNTQIWAGVLRVARDRRDCVGEMQNKYCIISIMFCEGKDQTAIQTKAAYAVRRTNRQKTLHCVTRCNIVLRAASLVHCFMLWKHNPTQRTLKIKSNICVLSTNFLF